MFMFLIIVKKKKDIRIFEINNIYSDKENLTYNLGLLHDSKINEEEPLLASKKLLLETLKLFNIEIPLVEFKKMKDNTVFNPYASANVFYQGKKIAIIGELHPKILREYKYIRLDKIKERLFYFELIIKNFKE